jgi:hypothetical protein
MLDEGVGSEGAAVVVVVYVVVDEAEQSQFS